MGATQSSLRPAIVILGKARGRKPESTQLLARAAAATALWHVARERPFVLMVARDAPDGTPDAARVAARLEALGVPRERILARAWSNCTMIEARAVRVLVRRYGLAPVTVITHPYHRRRAERLFREVLPDVRVVALRPSVIRALAVPPQLDFVVNEVAGSMPRGFDLARETLVEAVLSALHRVDRRGKFERWLADQVRPQA